MNPILALTVVALGGWVVLYGGVVGIERYLYPPQTFSFSGGQFCDHPDNALCVHHCTNSTGDDVVWETIHIAPITQVGCMAKFNSCQVLKSVCEVGFAHPDIICVCTSLR